MNVLQTVFPGSHVYVGGLWWPVAGVGGQPLPVRCYLLDKRVLEFRPGDGYNKRRRTPVEACVWHWTGGEREPLDMVKTLQARKLGIEFAIGRDGMIYQFCDPNKVDTADAGILNSRSCGVEIVNYGYSAQRGALARVLSVPVVPTPGRDRPTYEASTHALALRTARFYPAQLEAALGLADALSSALGIPRVVPAEAYDLTVLPGVLDFRGHLSHSHITAKKRDCGPELLQTLRGHFAQEPAHH